MSKNFIHLFLVSGVAMDLKRQNDWRMLLVVLTKHLNCLDNFFESYFRRKCVSVCDNGFVITILN